MLFVRLDVDLEPHPILALDVAVHQTRAVMRLSIILRKSISIRIRYVDLDMLVDWHVESFGRGFVEIVDVRANTAAAAAALRSVHDVSRIAYLQRRCPPALLKLPPMCRR